MRIDLDDFLFDRTANFQDSVFFKNSEAIKPVVIRYDSKEVKIKKYIGRGNYHVVFFTDYIINGISKPAILKLFLPQTAVIKDEIVRLEYSFDYEESTEAILLKNISLKLPSQIDLYINKLEKYRGGQKIVATLLEKQELNACIPKCYDEGVFNSELKKGSNLLLAYSIYEYGMDEDLDCYFKKNADISTKIDIVSSLANFMNELYKNRLLYTDIKASNFMFHRNEKVKNFDIKILDWDSIVKLDSNGIPEDKDVVFHCSEGYIPIEIRKYKKENIGLGSLLFMFGFMLYRALFIEQIENGDLPQSITPGGAWSEDVKFGVDDLEGFVELCNEKYSTNLTIGFMIAFKDILNKTYTNYYKNRYDSNGANGIDLFTSDLTSLKEIYENKGIHPKVMLDNAIKIAEGNENRFDLSIFDECR